MNLQADNNDMPSLAEAPRFDPRQEAWLAQALGAPLYRSTWHIPAYRIGEVGLWRLALCPFHIEPGYVTRQWALSALPLLMRRCTDSGGEGWEVWMSLTPHEIESQELACRHARGHVVVMGLGMGWVAVNIAFNVAVDSVTVVERDQQVIDLFASSGALDGLPETARAKLRIVRSDALAWRPAAAVDFLYVDIWRDLDEPQVLDQVRLIQQRVDAGMVYFWGQEIKLARLLDAAPDLRFGPALRAHVAAHTGLPLLMPHDGAYAAMMGTVMDIRRSLDLIPR